jgi:hypothetical protein
MTSVQCKLLGPHVGGVTTYRPLATFVWRKGVKFKPWPAPGYWHQMQEIGFE